MLLVLVSPCTLALLHRMKSRWYTKLSHLDKSKVSLKRRMAEGLGVTSAVGRLSAFLHTLATSAAWSFAMNDTLVNFLGFLQLVCIKLLLKHF